MLNYVYYNPNPDARRGKHWHRDDCVIRALAGALHKSWTTVYLELCEIGLKHFDIPLSDKVINAYMKEQGWELRKLPCWTSVAQFAIQHPNGTYVIRIHGHLTRMTNGVIYDTWNCNTSKMKTYYSPKTQ